MTTVKFQLETLTCPSCVKKIESNLRKTTGVKEAKVLFHSSKVKATIDETQVSANDLETIITNLGYPVQ
ncbi:heavy-metal-associated domain-containing protein [Evansella sp. AB-P1]|uniref:heavy-metal-associated domain-containing protein n=1 Tax=Evansella sp. AB-P1 TaxID=3037653 RepID=UPI00241D9C90|nr:heavy-metal-associated domain-containing protein [Evansella sp. AB-P1]MDG5789376.1 heavy-metal-associated domain-containing protein [Evansella sp. AB-P1]